MPQELTIVVKSVQAWRSHGPVDVTTEITLSRLARSRRMLVPSFSAASTHALDFLYYPHVSRVCVDNDRKQIDVSFCRQKHGNFNLMFGYNL